MSDSPKKSIKGRGSTLEPNNRFERIHLEDDWEHLEGDADFLAQRDQVATQYFVDQSQSIVSQNNSPDIPFRYSLNPYRGCQHGCSYCYARPTHEYLGLNAGIDFESKIFVKHDAANLLTEFLRRKSYEVDWLMLSGVTDAYQPIERKLQITRQCLQVAKSANQAVGIVTKNALVTRDIDILAPMAEKQLAQVNISITTLDGELARDMEPRTSTPAARLRAVKECAAAGIPVRVMVAPIIPGLNDHEIAGILAAAKEAGAQAAVYTLLRLPLTVEPVFLDWLERLRAGSAEKVKGRITTLRDGKLNDSTFGARMRGTGKAADQLRDLFQLFSKKHGLAKKLPPLRTDLFVRPDANDGQLRLF